MLFEERITLQKQMEPDRNVQNVASFTENGFCSGQTLQG